MMKGSGCDRRQALRDVHLPPREALHERASEKECPDHGSDRISGKAQHTARSDPTERDGLAGLHRESCADGCPTRSLDRSNGMIGVASGNATGTDDEIEVCRGFGQASGVAVRIVGDTAEVDRFARPAGKDGEQHRPVGVVLRGRAQGLAGIYEFVPGGQDADTHPPRDLDRAAATRRQECDVTGIEPFAGSSDDRRLIDILALPANVLACLGGPVQVDDAITNVDALLHRHGTHTRWEDGTGQKPHDTTGSKASERRPACANGTDEVERS